MGKLNEKKIVMALSTLNLLYFTVIDIYEMKRNETK